MRHIGTGRQTDSRVCAWGGLVLVRGTLTLRFVLGLTVYHSTTAKGSELTVTSVCCNSTAVFQFELFSQLSACFDHRSSYF